MGFTTGTDLFGVSDEQLQSGISPHPDPRGLLGTGGIPLPSFGGGDGVTPGLDQGAFDLLETLGHTTFGFDPATGSFSSVDRQREGLETSLELNDLLFNAQIGAAGAGVGSDLASLGLRQDILGLRGQGVDIDFNTLLQERQLLEDLRANALKQTATQITEAKRTGKAATFAEEVDASARGASVSIGHREAIQNIDEQLANTLEGIRLRGEAEQSTFGFREASKEADIAQNRIDKGILGLESQILGLSGTGIQDRLGAEITRLGLERDLEAHDIIQGLSSLDDQTRALATEMWLFTFGNYPLVSQYPELFSGFNAGGGGNPTVPVKGAF